ncbi:MAG: tryptophan synthase subunit alpha [Deltaproteobacteria bacterium]|nr:tryptophan synthase subunit alpha [Deltaproteobacteria bacterium]MBW2353546.1 tryptophan synthase subunit alpha [Deltaproteobacteria bacterium]HDZ91713.1 tryptophan synthase subunit alpha [Deltaproteobacteria bacterium]
MGLETYIRNELKKKDILLMTHVVLGYPSLEDSFTVIETMVGAGVDLMELQIPCSKPVADGPVILRANREALENGGTVQLCLDLAARAVREFHIPFLIMTYCNVVFRHGVESFVSAMAERGLKGAIIPDLPHEEGSVYLWAMEKSGLAPILIFSPSASDEQMKYLASHARGFIYCMAREGVTGAQTTFSDEMRRYLLRCRSATTRPLAVGFGVKKREDVDFLKGKADVAVIGSQAIRVIERRGIEALPGFIRGLR